MDSSAGDLAAEPARARRASGWLRSLTTLVLLLTILPGQVQAQDAREFIEDATGLRIQRVNETPNIDGVLNEEIWLRATVAQDFHQVNPVEFDPPSERTEVYLLYDRDTLFVAARMFDAEPDQILARILRQGQGIGSDDRFFVHIDSFNNRRSGYLFGVNPNGVRYDGIFENINDRSWDWDGIWQAAASITDEGWVVEIAIPFKTLSFDPTNTTWRMNFERSIERRNESMAWSSRNRNTDLSTMREVRGISQIDQGMGLDIVPSMSMTSVTRLSGDASQPDLTKTDGEPSVDVFYKITTSLNGAVTVNTDFSATEVDDRQVNLTRFSLFFPERRDFFLQDSDIFQFGRLDQDGRPFFSRTLGIGSDGVEVPIEYGGRVSGRIGRFDIGTLAIRQDATATVDATTALVGRVAANVLEESSVGMILTSGDPASNLDNNVFGVDFRFLDSRMVNGRGAEGEAWIQKTDSENLAGDDLAFGIGMRFPASAGFRGGFGFKRFEDNFNPAMGFVRRTGIEDFDFFFNHQWRPRGGAIRTINSGINFSQISYLDNGDIQSENFNLNLINIDLNSQDGIGVSLSQSKEGLRNAFPISQGIVIARGLYTFNNLNVNVRTGNQRVVGIGLFLNEGEFYDGDRSSIGGFISWRPSPHFRTNLNYQYNDIELPGGSFVTRVMRLNLEAIFSSRLSWTNQIQFDNVSNVMGLNSRLHWIPQAGREAFVVLNHNARDFDTDPLDPRSGFHSISNDISLKFSYTFRF